MERQKEQTLVLVKPDGLKRGLVGEIIKRFESRGFKLVALKMTQPTPAHVRRHYLATNKQLTGMGNNTLESLAKFNMDVVKEFGTNDPLKLGRMINNWNVEFLTSGPVIAMILEGLHAVEMARKIIGNTVPAKAETGTIRGDFSVDSPIFANMKKRAMRNLAHASGTVEEAQREIKHWFSKTELYNYKKIDEEVLFG